MAPPVAIAASGAASVSLNVPAGTKEITRAAAPNNIVAGFLNESWAREEVCAQVTLGWWPLIWLFIWLLTLLVLEMLNVQGLGRKTVVMVDYASELGVRLLN